MTVAAKYQVILSSCTTGQALAVFDSEAFYELRYSRALDDIGKLVLTLPGNNQYRPLFTLDSFIDVYRTDPSSPINALILEDTYLVRLAHRYRQDTDERFVVGGVSLNHLIKRRIIDPADDPAASGGYSTKAGAADTLIRAWCNEQMGPGASAARQTAGLTLSTVPGSGLGVGGRYRFENLLVSMQDLAHRGNTDFLITRTGGVNLLLAVGVIGSDKTKSSNYPFNAWVGLTPTRGNLLQPSYQLDRTQELNFVYALGPGQGANRQLIKQAGTTVTDSPFNRIEFTSDGRQIDATNTLQTAANAALWDNLPKLEFTYQPTGLEPGNIYRLDWDMGDKITAFWDEFTQDLRVMNVDITVNEQGEIIKPTVGPYTTT